MVITIFVTAPKHISCHLIFKMYYLRYELIRYDKIFSFWYVAAQLQKGFQRHAYEDESVCKHCTCSDVMMAIFESYETMQADLFNEPL